MQRKLRSELFKTMERDSTRFITVRDTLTAPIGPDDPSFYDAFYFDAQHCRQGRLGIGYHFLVLVDGTIQLCRDVDTCGAHSRDLDRISVCIGVVGGKDAEGNRAYTRTSEQEASVGQLIKVLQWLYPLAEVDDHPFRQLPPPQV